MAFNWQSFKTRTLTAAIFVVVMLAGLLINRWTFFILFSVIHFGCWWEYLKLVEKRFNIIITRFNKFLLMDLGYIMFWLIGFREHDTPNLPITLGSLTISLEWTLISIIFFGLVIFLFWNKKISLSAKWMFFAGFIYISLCLGLMLDLYAYSNSPFRDFKTTDIDIHDTKLVAPGYFYPAGIIASLWINDTIAYIMGSLIGKRQMSKISPKKTWEGTISGVVLSAGVIFLFSKFALPLPYLSPVLISVAFISSITGTFGDLLESKLKRMAGVKDSGHIMPGHGGFLDRFDSLLVAIPFVWLYVYFFMS
jgi:phosphatidate cytidylyltransferase